MKIRIPSVLCYITLFDITTNVANFEIAFAICIIDIRFIYAYGVQWPKIWMQLVFAFQKVNKMPLLEYQQNNSSLQFFSCLQSLNLSPCFHITSVACYLTLPRFSKNTPKLRHFCHLIQINRHIHNYVRFVLPYNLYSYLIMFNVCRVKNSW